MSNKLLLLLCCGLVYVTAGYGQKQAKACPEGQIWSELESKCYQLMSADCTFMISEVDTPYRLEGCLRFTKDKKKAEVIFRNTLPTVILKKEKDGSYQGGGYHLSGSGYYILRKNGNKILVQDMSDEKPPDIIDRNGNKVN